MKNLENYGVVSLDNREMNETSGGDFGLFIICFVIGYFIGLAIAESN